MERFLLALHAYKRMSAKLEQILRDNVHPLPVRKNDIIQPIGTISDNLYFIEKGLFHLFVDRQGEQVSIRFKKEDEFIIALKELAPTRKIAEPGIEALEDGLLWLFPGPLVSRLKLEYHEFTIQFTTIVMKDLISIHEAMDCSDPDGGSSNYDQLRKDSPELLHRVPIAYLASYTSIPEKIFRHLHSSKIELKVSTTRRRKR